MLRTILVFAILVPGVIASLSNRFAALLMYLWFAMFRPQDFIWFDITNLRLSVLLGLILVVPALFSGIVPDVKHPLSAGMVLFVLAAGLAQLATRYPENSWPWLDQLVRLVVVTLLAIRLVDTPRRFLLVIAVITVSLGFYSTKAGLVSILGGGTRYFDGLSGAFTDNNGYALAVTMILPLFLVLTQNVAVLVGGHVSDSTARWLRWGLMACLPLNALTVISTFSRGGFLALVASAGSLAFLQRRKGGFVALLGFGALAGLTLAPMPSGYLDRLETIRIDERVQEDSALSRLHFWQVAVDMFADRPFGVGLFNYEPEFDRYDSSRGRFGTERSVHSSYFQVLAETGILGTASFVGLLVYSLRVLARIRTRSKDDESRDEVREFLFTTSNGLIASMVAFMVGGAFLAGALNDLTWLTFGLVVSLDRLSWPMSAPSRGEATPLEAAPRLAVITQEGTVLP